MVLHCHFSVHRPRCEYPSRCFSIPRRQLSTALLTAIPFIGSPQGASAAIIDETIAIDVFQVVSPSIVTIQDVSTIQGREVEDGIGTGFVWDSFGHIVTNSHVINKVAEDKSGAQKVRVSFNSGTQNVSTYEAQIIGNKPAMDLAVLKIQADSQILYPVRVGSATGLRVGQFVFALGNPSGLSKTQTSGVVSGLKRSLPSPVGTQIPAIQTDAAISAGNSGGPLVDSSGAVVGVCTATFTKQGTGRSSGVNLAIPIDVVRDIVPRLIVDSETA